VAPATVAGALESRRSLGLSAAPSPAFTGSPANQSRERLVQYSQQAQFVAGKSFFQNGPQWTDSAVQKQPSAKRVRIQFGSEEYFDLVAKQPKALPWLALGQNVQFVLDNTVYDIYE
jgi:hypothetical protein